MDIDITVIYIHVNWNLSIKTTFWTEIVFRMLVSQVFSMLWGWTEVFCSYVIRAYIEMVASGMWSCTELVGSGMWSWLADVVALEMWS